MYHGPGSRQSAVLPVLLVYCGHNLPFSPYWKEGFDNSMEGDYELCQLEKYVYQMPELYYLKLDVKVAQGTESIACCMPCTQVWQNSGHTEL